MCFRRPADLLIPFPGINGPVLGRDGHCCSQERFHQRGSWAGAWQKRLPKFHINCIFRDTFYTMVICQKLWGGKTKIIFLRLPLLDWKFNQIQPIHGGSHLPFIITNYFNYEGAWHACIYFQGVSSFCHVAFINYRYLLSWKQEPTHCQVALW